MDWRAVEVAGAGALLALVAFAVGLTFPDIDRPLGLGHRSGLTHSVLPLAAYAVARWRRAVAGLAGGLGVHLAADCFPRAMTGYATVKLPVAGSIGAAASYGWLAVNAVLALTLCALALRRLHHPLAAAAVGAGAAVCALGYLWRDPGGWPVLALTAVAGLAWWRVARRS